VEIARQVIKNNRHDELFLGLGMLLLYNFDIEEFIDLDQK